MSRSLSPNPDRSSSQPSWLEKTPKSYADVLREGAAVQVRQSHSPTRLIRVPRRSPTEALRTARPTALKTQSRSKVNVRNPSSSRSSVKSTYKKRQQYYYGGNAQGRPSKEASPSLNNRQRNELPPQSSQVVTGHRKSSSSRHGASITPSRPTMSPPTMSPPAIKEMNTDTSSQKQMFNPVNNNTEQSVTPCSKSTSSSATVTSSFRKSPSLHSQQDSDMSQNTCHTSAITHSVQKRDMDANQSQKETLRSVSSSDDHSSVKHLESQPSALNQVCLAQDDDDADVYREKYKTLLEYEEEEHRRILEERLV